MYTDEWQSELHTLVMDEDQEWVIEHPESCPTADGIFGPDYDCAVQSHLVYAGIEDLIPTGEHLAPGRYTIAAWSYTFNSPMYGREHEAGLGFAGNR